MNGYMTFDDLNREQILALKQRYLMELDDEGTLNEVLYDDDECEDSLSWGELADADNLVSDDVVRDHFSGMLFTEEDFV